jgi:hypothetical protein
MKKNNPPRSNKEVEAGNDEQTDPGFPGFPGSPHHAPRQEDVSAGSASAFDATEQLRDDEDNDDPASERRDK